MKEGTWTTRPVSVLAGLVTLEAVADLRPGSVSTDGQLDGGGQVNAHGLAVVVTDLDLQIRREVLDRIAERGSLENGLLVVHRVHEVVVVAVGIEELHGDLVHDDLIDGAAERKAPRHGSGANFAQLGWMKAARLPGVRCSTLKTRSQLVLCLMIDPGPLCGGGIDI